ncbi:mutS protein homolog 4-like [Rhopilema esculentum]|uniref:mutS protein homolog 4-like n=1 Tax=Rhopilema esculentum TaxID=499914 RepID=UPI0031D4DB86
MDSNVSTNAKSNPAKYSFQLTTPSDAEIGFLSTSNDLTSVELTTPSLKSKNAVERIRGSSSFSGRRSSVTPYGNRVSRGPTSKTPRPSVTPRHLDASTLVAIVEGRGLAKGEIGMAAIDLKGSEMTLFQFSDGASYMRLLTKLNILSPIEILMPSTACENGKMATLFDLLRERYPNTNLTTVQRRYFNETAGLQYIKDLCAPEYATVEIAVRSKYYCLATAAALLKYVEFIQNVVYAPNSLKVVFKGSENTTMIDTSVAKNLELVQNTKDSRSSHSLFGIMNHTKTPGGSRLLRANILQPPCDLQTIDVRLSCIEELMDKEELFLNLQAVLSKFLDIEHLISLCIQIPKKEDVKAAETRITEIIYLKHTLELVESLKDVIKEGKNPLFVIYTEALEDERFSLLLETIQTVINEETMLQKGTLNMRTQKVFLIKPGINGMLDVVRKVYTECIDDIAELIKQLSDRYGMTLKPSYSVGRGFFIQICDNVPIDSLPDFFIKIVKTKSLVTCTTDDLIKMNGRVTEALNEIYLLTAMVISELMVNIRKYISCMHKLAEGVSILDLIVSFTHACSISNYVRPEFTDTLAIKSGRHPILDKISSPGSVIPNDIYASEASCFIIMTGPNMSGKSTYLKQIVLLQVMAQVGSFVPAEYASLRLADQIFARVGTDDDIETNSSTFTLEMKEMNYILKNASDKSLIIIDELGRGTSVDEGIGICYSICEHLLQIKAFTFFATHFMELCNLETMYPCSENYHMTVHRSDESEMPSLVFNHVLSKGRTQQTNYGISLAKMSSLPESLIETAMTISSNIRNRENNVHGEVPQEARKRRAIFRLGTRLLQVAQHSKLDDVALRVYLEGLKRHYMQEIQSSKENTNS